MDTVKRLKEFLKDENISKSEFYRRTGISNGYLDKVKSIGADKIEIILDKFDTINLYWLINGQGDPTLEPNEKEMVSTRNYYPYAAVKDQHLVKENFAPHLKQSEELELQRLRNQVVRLEDKISELEKRNNLLVQFLNEKDERIKLLVEKIG